MTTDDQRYSRLQHDRCKQLLAEHRPGHRADEEWIRARLDEVAVIEASITNPYNRGQVALARGRRALSACMVDIALGALRSALEAFSQPAYTRSTTPRCMGDSAKLLAVAYATNNDTASAAAELQTARDAYLQSKSAECIAGWIDATIYLSNLLIREGRYDEALLELRAARSYLGQSDQGRIRIDLAITRVFGARGQYEAALQLLAWLNADDDELSAQISGTQGVILAEAGRLAEAAPKLLTARDQFAGVLRSAQARIDAEPEGPDEDDVERLERLRTSGAICTMNLGAVYGAEGEHAKALACYEAALSLLHTVPLAASRVIACRLNIGVEAMAADNKPRARAAFDDVDRFFSAHRDATPLRAGYLLNLGRLRDLEGCHLDAQQQYRQARDEFLDVGVVEWAARCGLNLASSMWMAELPDAATEELIPAMLVLDRMRFQFPTASARQAWRQTIAGSTQLAFALADGNPELVAELIENTINSGVHSASAVPVSTAGSEVELQDRLQLPGDELTSAESVTARSGNTSGAGVLIAGAILPMHPPPQVRLPNGKVALQCYYELAQETYGPGQWVNAEVVAVCQR